MSRIFQSVRAALGAFGRSAPALAEPLSTTVDEVAVAPTAVGLTPAAEAGRASRERFRRNVLAHLTDIEDRVSAIKNRPRAVEDPPDRLADALRSEGDRPLFLAFSHDDYTASVGGLQLCLLREADALNARGYGYLHFAPAQGLHSVRDDGCDPVLGVRLDGQFLGNYAAPAIAAALQALGSAQVAPFAVHSLLGHSVASVSAILEAAAPGRGWFWVHDHAAVCAGIHLLHNDIAYCGAPPIDSERCGTCAYRSRRQVHLDAHRELIARFRMTVAAPSASALSIWLSGVAFRPSSVIIEPHCLLTEGAAADEPTDPSRPLRVAYLGVPRAHKGWFAFEALVRRFGDDPRYAFFHLGLEPVGELPLVFERVAVAPGRLDEMTDAVARLDIDLAMIWSICPETFCFTAHEAAASGAAILTLSDSGHPTRLVGVEHAGAVFADEEALFEAFESGDLRAICGLTERRPAKRALVYSRMSGELLA